MAILKGLCALIVLILCVIVVLFIDFSYQTFSMRQRQVNTDAIVVLAGGRGRVEEGIKLYRAHRARWLFLVGVDPSVRKKDLFREKSGERGGEDVLLENVSRNTLENAIHARDLITRKDVRSVLLITSRYHMMRSILLFNSVLPKDVAVYPYPVDSRNLKEEWWAHEGSFRLLFGEFYKYFLFKTFFIFAPGELRTNRVDLKAGP
ncbi:MAG: YdcF family protein [Geobacteraceae bacterium]|nr:YdcF family protein [Geobacteraceae bacterium]